MRTGQVILKGPFTKEEKAKLDRARERRVSFQQELAELRQELIDNPDHEYRKLIEEEIAHSEKILSIIRRIIPD